MSAAMSRTDAAVERTRPTQICPGSSSPPTTPSAPATHLVEDVDEHMRDDAEVDGVQDHHLLGRWVVCRQGIGLSFSPTMAVSERCSCQR